MTSTIDQPTTDTTTEPVCTTFTVGTLTIEAATEAEALRKYQRMVRAEALKAKDDMGWCESGTNERLRILGLRDIRSGIPMRVVVTATRTAYINVDADDDDEALKVVEEGGKDVLELASATVGRGWEVTAIASTGGPLVPTRTRSVGEPDDTVAGLQNTGSGVDLRRCDQYHNTGYYCTMPEGHEGQHAAGNGRTIVDVWAQRRR